MSEPRQEQCARCGSCTVVCPVYAVTGRESLTARGKLHLLGTDLADILSSNYQDLFAQCLLCGACEKICPRDLAIRNRVVAARSGFSRFYGRHAVGKSVVRLTLARPGLLEGLVRAGISVQKLSILPEKSGLRLKLGLLEEPRGQSVPEILAEERNSAIEAENVTYFTGCLARYIQPSILDATRRLYRASSGQQLEIPGTQACCGLAAWSSGKIEEARALARKNIAAFEETTGPIVTSCASCSSFLTSYQELFENDPEWGERATAFCSRIQEFASFFIEKELDRHLEPAQPCRLYYHEPCHLRFADDNKDAPRQLVDKLANIRRVDHEDKSSCCGQGGLFQVGYPELSEKIFSRAYSLLDATDAEVVVTTCSGCLMQWQIGLTDQQSGVQAVHLAVFLADCLNIDT